MEAGTLVGERLEAGLDAVPRTRSSGPDPSSDGPLDGRRSHRTDGFAIAVRCPLPGTLVTCGYGVLVVVTTCAGALNATEPSVIT